MLAGFDEDITNAVGTGDHLELVPELRVLRLVRPTAGN
jgi:hypothetical protein